MTKKPTLKGKQKADKRKKRSTEGEVDEEDYEDEDESEGEVELDDEEDDEARFSDDYEEEDKRPSRGKRGRTGGRGGQGKDKAKEKDVAPILKKTKFEGNYTATTSTGGTKRLRTKRGAEDVLVDVVGDSGTPEPSSIGSPTTTNPTIEVNKDDNASSSAQPPLKKPKLPTIKKLKTAASTGGGTGPSTPTSVTGMGGKPPTLPPPPPSGSAAGNKLGISEGTKPARPKTNTTSDLDLSNPSLYAELFKNVSALVLNPSVTIKYSTACRKCLEDRAESASEGRREEEGAG